jgi:hypothetical protein
MCFTSISLAEHHTAVMKFPEVDMRTMLAICVLLLLPSAASAQRWGRDRFPQSGACFFQDSNYRGDYFCIRAGEDVGRVPKDLNDGISSIRVFGRAEVEVFRDVRFNGGSARFAADIRNLKNEGWNDRISSLRVQIASREERSRDRADERRGERMTAGEAQNIVRRAYQAVLKREPDQASIGYVNAVMNDNWSQQDVERELRKSDEYRNRR